MKLMNKVAHFLSDTGQVRGRHFEALWRQLDIASLEGKTGLYIFFTQNQDFGLFSAFWIKTIFSSLKEQQQLR